MPPQLKFISSTQQNNYGLNTFFFFLVKRENALKLASHKR